MKITVKIASLAFLLAFCCASAPAAGGNIYNGRERLLFSRFLLLESPLDRGQQLSIDENTPGVLTYTGGAIPSSLKNCKKMYTFKVLFSILEVPSTEFISLYMGLTEFPYAIYLNGSEIFRKGRNTDTYYNSSMRAAYEIFLPPALLRRGGPNEIVLQAYPRSEKTSLDILYIDSPENISQAVFLRNFVGINLIQGAMVLSLIIGLYFFILYLAEKKRQKTRFIFALFCFGFFFATISIATFHDTSNEQLMENLSKLGLLLSSTFILRFFMEFTGVLNRLKAVRIFVTSLGCIMAFSFLFQRSKEALTSWFSLAILVVVAPYLFLCLVILAIAIIQHRQKGLGLLLTGFTVMIVAVIHDVLYLSANALPYAWLITYGFFSIVLSIFALLAEEQARLYHESLQSEADILVDRNRIRMLNDELVKQKDSFFRFVPTEFLQLLGRTSVVDIKLGDSTLRYLTIMFTDIRRFTSIAEGMLPMEIFEFLNSYLFRMEKAVLLNGGFVDKYIGDGVMALFSSDEGKEAGKNPMSADNSLRAALHIKRELHIFNKEIEARHILPIQIGIGINTGDVTLGTVGSDTRLDTTVIGDAVNLSSRLESLTKLYRTQTLISENTVLALERQEDFSLRLIDTVSVPGRIKSVKIFELLDPTIEADALIMTALQDFTDAVSLYRAGNFAEALSLFNRLIERNPGDHVPVIYAERCRTFQKNMPDGSWDGVFRINEK